VLESHLSPERARHVIFSTTGKKNTECEVNTDSWYEIGFFYFFVDFGLSKSLGRIAI
jgi:hypothetical protein